MFFVRRTVDQNVSRLILSGWRAAVVAEFELFTDDAGARIPLCLATDPSVKDPSSLSEDRTGALWRPLGEDRLLSEDRPLGEERLLNDRRSTAYRPVASVGLSSGTTGYLRCRASKRASTCVSRVGPVIFFWLLLLLVREVCSDVVRQLRYVSYEHRGIL